jgi:hypothetical protein
MPVLVNGAPEIRYVPVDHRKDFVELPRVAGFGSTLPQLVGILLAEFQTPLAHGLVRHNDAAFGQQSLDIAAAAAEAIVQPDGITDDLLREAVACIERGSGSCVHTASIAWIQQVSARWSTT